MQCANAAPDPILPRHRKRWNASIEITDIERIPYRSIIPCSNPVGHTPSATSGIGDSSSCTIHYPSLYGEAFDGSPSRENGDWDGDITPGNGLPTQSPAIGIGGGEAVIGFPGWEKRSHPMHGTFYIDHNTRETHWHPPQAMENKYDEIPRRVRSNSQA